MEELRSGFLCSRISDIPSWWRGEEGLGGQEQKYCGTRSERVRLVSVENSNPRYLGMAMDGRGTDLSIGRGELNNFDR